MLPAHPVGAADQIFDQDPVRFLRVPDSVRVIDLGYLPLRLGSVVEVISGVHDTAAVNAYSLGEQ